MIVALIISLVMICSAILYEAEKELWDDCKKQHMNKRERYFHFIFTNWISIGLILFTVSLFYLLFTS